MAGVANQLGATPLYLACENGNAALVRVLLAAGRVPARGASERGDRPDDRRARRERRRGRSASGSWRRRAGAGGDRGADRSHVGCVTAARGGSSKPCWTRERTSTHAHGFRPVVTAHSARTSSDGAVVVVEEGGLHGAAVRGAQRRPRVRRAAAGGGRRCERHRAGGHERARRGGAQRAPRACPRRCWRRAPNPNAVAAGVHAFARGDSPRRRAARAGVAGRMARIRTPASCAAPATPARASCSRSTWPGAERRRSFSRPSSAGATSCTGSPSTAPDPHTGLDGGVTPLMAAAGMLTRGFGRAGKDRLGREMDSAEMEVALTQDPDRRSVMASGIDAVKAAVELGAEVNAASATGDTALHLAAFHGFKTVVRYLVSRGARLDATNLRGETPLDRALAARAPARLTRSLTDYSDTSTADLLRAPRSRPTRTASPAPGAHLPERRLLATASRPSLTGRQTVSPGPAFPSRRNGQIVLVPVARGRHGAMLARGGGPAPMKTVQKLTLDDARVIMAGAEAQGARESASTWISRSPTTTAAC